MPLEQLLTRARRILQEDPHPSTTSGTKKKVCVRDSEKAIHQWKRLWILATALLRYLQTKNCLIEMMGAETVCPLELSEDEGFEKIYVNPEKSSSSSSKTPQPKQRAQWRVETHNHEQFVVGKELERGKGIKDAANLTHDPSVCQHPSHLMKGRGGKKIPGGVDRWWTCMACGSRWERLPLTHFEENAAASDRTVITFGQYMGATFGGIWKIDPQYCNWIMSTVESGDKCCAQMKKFAQYIAQREQRQAADIPAGAMDEEL